MKPKVIILGAGMVGKAMAIDLAHKFDVSSADIDQNALNFLKEKYAINTIVLDVSNKEELKKEIAPYDYVISAVPGFLGFTTLETVIEAGKNVVDITFMPENILLLNEKAEAHGVTAIVDCGVAPGIPNMIAGYYYNKMKISDFSYMVGGLPKIRTFPFEYKAPFSPIDVIEEYTRPARFLQNGIIIEKPPLSDAELINFSQAGTLEAFNSDGLRSLLYTLPGIPNISEKTLRYPGHIKLIMALQKAGFFSPEAINVNGQSIRPVDVTNTILFDAWKYEEGEEDFTVMKIIVNGLNNDKKHTFIYELFDTYDVQSGLSSMARTTGFTGTAALNMMHDKLFEQKGVFPPELIGQQDECYNYIMDYLSARNVIYTKKETIED